MEEKKETWVGAIAKVLSETETTNIRLGMRIEKLKNSYFYDKLIKFLKGDDSDYGSSYFHELKSLYDEFGYEKVNRILLSLDEVEQGGKKDE